MKLNNTQKLSLKIILLFTVAMLSTFIGDNLHSFFGDFICNGLGVSTINGKIEYYYHYGGTHSDIVIHWGYRHWIYFTMCVTLFIIQVIDIVNSNTK